jgi:hypothetical protein
MFDESVPVLPTRPRVNEPPSLHPSSRSNAPATARCVTIALPHDNGQEPFPPEADSTADQEIGGCPETISIPAQEEQCIVLSSPCHLPFYYPSHPCFSDKVL